MAIMAANLFFFLIWGVIDKKKRIDKIKNVRDASAQNLETFHKRVA